MNDKPMTREEFATKLVYRGFKLIGPRTLQYVDTDDVVTVFIERNIVIILGDGPCVVGNYTIIQVREGPDTFFWEGVLQDVLHKF